MLQVAGVIMSSDIYNRSGRCCSWTTKLIAGKIDSQTDEVWLVDP